MALCSPGVANTYTILHSCPLQLINPMLIRHAPLHLARPPTVNTLYAKARRYWGGVCGNKEEA